jgi:hypothetical protein
MKTNIVGTPKGIGTEALHIAGVIGSFWKDAKKELPKQTKGSYSDVDVFICRMYRYDIGRTKDGKWINMKNEPIDDVVLWAYMPKIGDEFKDCFNCL